MVLTLVASTSGAVSARPCASSSLPRGLSLPAPIVATTSCGRFEVGTGGRVHFLGPKSLPVPPGVNWYEDLSWYRIVRGHVVVGRGLRTEWRSHRSYPLSRGSGVGAVRASSNRVAFSFAAPPANWKRATLYVARRGSDERAVAVGETPIGWTGQGALVTWSHRGSLR